MTVRAWAKRHKPELRVVVNFWTFFLTPFAGEDVASQLLEKTLLTIQDALVVSLITAGIATGLVSLKEVSAWLGSK